MQGRYRRYKERHHLVTRAQARDAGGRAVGGLEDLAHRAQHARVAQHRRRVHLHLAPGLAQPPAQLLHAAVGERGVAAEVQVGELEGAPDEVDVDQLAAQRVGQHRQPRIGQVVEGEVQALRTAR